VRFKKKHAGETDFELNLASIIDCFTVLITYMLVSASFISLGVLDVSVPVQASVTQAPLTDPSKIDTLSVRIAEDRSIKLTVKGEQASETVLPPKEGKTDVGAFRAAIESVSAKSPGMDTAMITADPGVEYRELVGAIEAMKPRLPNVAIGEND
jgi:biopolymer transport protein ExbD